MQVFLTGASGFVGSHVLRVLVASGARVRCLARDPSRLVEPSEGEFDVVAGDLRDRELLERSVEGCELVYHCAAE